MTPVQTRGEPRRLPMWLGFGVFLAIATFFLWDEHKAHILGALPYGLLLLCLIMHFFMHRGHGGARADRAHDHRAGGSS